MTRGDSCTESARNESANVDVVPEAEPNPKASRAMTPSTANVIGRRSAGRLRAFGTSSSGGESGRSSVSVLMRSLP